MRSCQKQNNLVAKAPFQTPSPKPLSKVYQLLVLNLVGHLLGSAKTK